MAEHSTMHATGLAPIARLTLGVSVYVRLVQGRCARRLPHSRKMNQTMSVMTGGNAETAQ